MILTKWNGNVLAFHGSKSRRTWSIPCLLMPWPWYWQCEIEMFLPSMRVNLNGLGQYHGCWCPGSQRHQVTHQLPWHWLCEMGMLLPSMGVNINGLGKYHGYWCPGSKHQMPWYWQCKMGMFLPSMTHIRVTRPQWVNNIIRVHLKQTCLSLKFVVAEKLLRQSEWPCLTSISCICVASGLN